MKLTQYLIEQGRSAKGGWNRAQTDMLGVPWPLETGWKAKLDGVEIGERTYARFLALKNTHLSKDASSAGVPKHKTHPLIKARAKALVNKHGSGDGSGSFTTTCQQPRCEHPKCMCGLGRN